MCTCSDSVKICEALMGIASQQLQYSIVCRLLVEDAILDILGDLLVFFVLILLVVFVFDNISTAIRSRLIGPTGH